MLLAATATVPSIPAGTYRYAATVAGKPVGSATITVTTGPPLQIGEQASGAGSAQAASGKALLTLGPDLAPTAYTGDYNTSGTPVTVAVSLTASAAKIGNASYALTGNAKHFVVVEAGMTAGLFALPAQMQAWNDGSVQLIVPAMADMGGTLAIAPDPSFSGTRPATVPAQDTALAIGGPFPFTIWYDPSTYVPDEIDIPSQNAVVSRVRS